MNNHNLHKIRYEAFKSQDYESGVFDVTFDIGGRKLYANKFMVMPVSTTFASMISDRWTSAGQPIPIQTFGYDDFYQLLTYIHSGQCELTEDNIFTMVDMAEFYQVSDFKNYCDEYLMKIKFTFENIIHILEIASKYSLDKLKESFVPFLKRNRAEIFNHSQFSKEAILQILELDQSADSSQIVFQKVYLWAENQANAKIEADPNLNLDEAIKEILADFMPFFDFGKMSGHFVIQFVVGKSLLQPGPELSAILMKPCYQTSADFTNNICAVEITDESGRIMKGEFSDPGNIYDEIQKSKNVECRRHFNYFYWDKSRCHRPSQEIFKKRDCIEWYFIYDFNNDLSVKRRTQIYDSEDYLIAEMFPEDGFVLSEECRIEAISF